MIKPDSVLRRLPQGLDPRQAIYFDGIRHAVEIAELSYRRLQRTLTEIALTTSETSKRESYTSAFLDAWAFVDAVDRFRSLWASMSKFIVTQAAQGSGPTFADLAQPIRNLRNVSDHLSQRIDHVVSAKCTALGVLSWMTMASTDCTRAYCCTIVPGFIDGVVGHIVNAAGEKTELPTGLIHLSAGEHRANLSKIVPEMAKRVRHLEEGLDNWIQSLPTPPNRAGTDLLVRAIVAFDGTNAQITN